MAYLVPCIPCVHGLHGVHGLPCGHGIPCPMNSLWSWLTWSSWFTLWSWLTLSHEFLVFMAHMEFTTYLVVMAYLVPWIPWNPCDHGLLGVHDVPCGHGLPCAHGLPCLMNSLYSWLTWSYCLNLGLWITLPHKFLVFKPYRVLMAYLVLMSHLVARGLPCPKVASYPWCCRNHLDPTWGKHRATVSKDINCFICQFHLCRVLRSLAGLYDNPIPTRFLVPIDFSKIPAQV